MLDRIIIVTKPTGLEELLVRHYSRSQAAFFLASRGQALDAYDAEDAAYRACRDAVMAVLPREFSHEVVPRERLPMFLFRPRDLIIALGTDGIVVNVAKYLDGQLVVGVNPDPSTVDGILVRWSPDTLAAQMATLVRGDVPADVLTLARVRTNDGQEMLAVNDVLIGRRDPISARYAITYRGRTERQSSSGVLVSTGCGSTGWMRAVATGACAMTEGKPKLDLPFAWDMGQLVFAVREPFPSKATGTAVAVGVIRKGEELVIASGMPEGGAIFADGVIEDAIAFNAGTAARIGVADRVLRLVRPPPMERASTHDAV